MNTIDRKQAGILHKAIEEALKSVGEKYSVRIGTGSGSYTNSSFSVKVTAIISDTVHDDACNDVPISWINAYTQNAKWYGLPADGLGKKYKHAGAVYTVVGFRPKARVQVVVRKNDNKMFTSVSVDTIKRELDIK